MKIVVNYDFFKRVKLLNNPDSRLTIVKIRTKELFIKDLPILTFLNFTLTYPHISNFIYFTILDYLCFSFFYDLSIKKYNEDIFTIKVLNKYSKELAKLASMFNKFNIYTSYDLLLETELYHKETNLIFNNGLPKLVEKKYLNIPTYTITGDIEPVSIEQEHIIGSKQYVLTLGSPSNVHDYAPNPI